MNFQVKSMRIKVTLQAKEKYLKIPANYQYMLQGFIYRQLAGDPDFQAFLHETGYQYEKRKFKAFTYSRLSGKSFYDQKRKQLIFEGPVTLYIGSAVSKFIQLLGQSLLLSDEFIFHQTKMTMEALQYEKEPEINGEKVKIKMLSPVTVYSTFKTAQGKKRTQYYNPYDPAFSSLIAENARKKYEAFHKKTYDGQVVIRPVNVKIKDKVVTKFKNIYINAWNGIYELKAPQEVIRFLYDSGIGGKNSQGFGMFKILND